MRKGSKRYSMRNKADAAAVEKTTGEMRWGWRPELISCSTVSKQIDSTDINTW